MERYPGTTPNQRFSPGYYQATRYSYDPVSGRIVEERPGGSVGAPAQAIQRYSGDDIRTSDLGDDAGPSRGFGPGPGARRFGGDDAERGGGYAEEPGAQGEAGQGGSLDIDDFGGFSTFGSLVGLATGVPALGLVGGAVDTIRDKIDAEDFDPEYEGDLGKWGSSLLNELTGGHFGRSHRDRAIDEYMARTGTGLPRAALAASGRGSYSGPKGVNARSKARRGLGRGGQAAEVSSSRDITSGPSRGRGGIADPDIGRSAARSAQDRGGDRGGRDRDRDPQRDSRDVRDSGSF